jgi:hypothetical protein
MEKKSSNSRVFIMAHNEQSALDFIARYRLFTIGKYLCIPEQLRGLMPNNVDIYRLDGWTMHPNHLDIMEAINERGFTVKDWL